MTRAAIAALACLLCGSARAAEPQGLARDLVAARDGRYVYEDYSVCRVDPQQISQAAVNGAALPARLGELQFQMHVRAEAAADGFISRDSFVATVAHLSQTLQLGVFWKLPSIDSGKAIQALHCHSVPQPIGTPEIDVKLTMTRDGMQLEMIDPNTRRPVRSTLGWQ